MLISSHSMKTDLVEGQMQITSKQYWDGLALYNIHENLSATPVKRLNTMTYLSFLITKVLLCCIFVAENIFVNTFTIETQQIGWILEMKSLLWTMFNPHSNTLLSNQGNSLNQGQTRSSKQNSLDQSALSYIPAWGLHVLCCLGTDMATVI